MVNPDGTIHERLTGLLNPESLEQPTQEQEAETEPESVEVEADEAETEEAETVEVEADAEEDSEAAETSYDDTEAEEEYYTVKIAGEEQQVTLDELRKGYMMDADYRRKTQEVAEQRKQVETKLSELDEKVSDAESILEIELADLNSDESRKLKEYDPAAWLEKKERVEAKAKKLQDLKAKRDSELQKVRSEQLQKEATLLKEAIPEWLDDDTLKVESEKIGKMWERMGFTDTDLAQFSDHRLIVLSRKAAKYDELMSSNPADKKVKQKPKAAKPAAAVAKVDKRTKQFRDKREAVRKSGGNMRLAASAISDLL